MIAEPIRSVYWSLPYTLRRTLFRSVRPRIFRSLQARRRIDTDTGYSLKPFDELKCIFVHIPKCAGVSVCRSLFGNLGAGHFTVRKYQVIFSKAEFESYFKFSFVRNPWDRLVSAYYFLKKGGVQRSDREWAEHNLAGFRDFDSFVKGWVNRENLLESWNHFMPQYWFICGPDGTPLVDFLGHFETIERDYDIIRGRLNSGSSLSHHNRTLNRNRDFRKYYSNESRRIVADVYREDIEIFEYDFE